MANTGLICESEFSQPTLFVRLSETYRPDMTPDQVYDCVRWAWDAKLTRVSQCMLVLGVFVRRVVGAFLPERWDFASNITPPANKSNQTVADDIANGRVAFTGKIADDCTWKRFVGREVQMGRNPIHYVGEAKVVRHCRPRAL